MILMSTGFALSLLAASNTGLGVKQENTVDASSALLTFALESKNSCDSDPVTCAGIVGNFVLESNVDENGFVVLDTESSWTSINKK